MAVPRSFTDLVAQYGGFDPEATFQFLNQWQPYEGGHTHNNATYNYLNTTQDMGGNTSMNSVGVKQYRSEDEGARATAQTLLNGRYGSIVKALQTGDFSDVNGIAGDVRVWTSGSREGGSNFADSLSGGIDIQGGGGVQAQEADPWSLEADQFDLILEELMADRPSRDDPAFQYDVDGDGVPEFDPMLYAEALKSWTQTITEVSGAADQLRLASYGLTTLPDGTMVALGDLPPDQAKAIDDANYNVYASILNDLNLADYDLRVAREQDIQDTVKSNFELKMDEFEAGISYDDLNLARAGMDIDRSLAGLEESRNRADLINKAQETIQKWGTAPGKTTHSLAEIMPGLFKASGSNIDPSLISITYPGTTRIDPEEIMRKYDEQLGVTGALPSVPSLITQPGSIPRAPTLTPPTTPLPSLLTPRPPAPVVSPPAPQRVVGPGGSLIPHGIQIPGVIT